MKGFKNSGIPAVQCHCSKEQQLFGGDPLTTCTVEGVKWVNQIQSKPKLSSKCVHKGDGDWRHQKYQINLSTWFMDGPLEGIMRTMIDSLAMIR